MRNWTVKIGWEERGDYREQGYPVDGGSAGSAVREALKKWSAEQKPSGLAITFIECTGHPTEVSGNHTAA